MWIARDRNNKLHLFYRKPIEKDGSFYDITNGNVFQHKCSYWNGPETDYKVEWKNSIEMNDILFPEITFENSPKELKIK